MKPKYLMYDENLMWRGNSSPKLLHQERRLDASLLLRLSAAKVEDLEQFLKFSMQ